MNKKYKTVLGILFFVTVFGLTFATIFKDQSLESFIQVVKQVDYRYILLGCFLMFLFIVCDAAKLFLSLSGLKQKTTFIKTLGYAFVGFYFNSITPSASGGQPAQIYYMKKDKIDFAQSSVTLLLTTITYQIGTLIYAGIMFISNYSFISNQLTGMKFLLILSVLINGIAITAMLALMFSPTLVRRLMGAALNFLYKIKVIKKIDQAKETVEKQLQEYSKSAHYIKNQPTLVIKIFLITFIQLTASYLVPFLVYKSFNLTQYSPIEMLAVQSLLTLAISSIPLPGGMGASEGGFLSMFRLFFAAPILIPAMLLSRMISFYGILLVSGFITLVVHYFSSKKKLKVMSFNQIESY
ncbi:MAG: lysylphosphatidylglycerol synthase transmembrane domain-containing protein [Turicibacter sp.]